MVAVVAGGVVAQFQAEAKSTRASIDLFAVRATSAAGFLESYTSYVLSREQTLAEERLASPTVTDDQFRDFLDVFGFGPAVLLDARGRVLDIAPFRATAVGTDATKQYAHLARAVAGRPSVSDIVPSLATGEPIVAFATPFDTPFGRRVVSGAFDVASRPMGLYLRHVLPYANGGVYLVDSRGKVIASNQSEAASIPSRPPARVTNANGHGRFNDAHGARIVYTTLSVTDTPWRLVLTLPESTLLQPLSTLSRVLPWVLLAAFALALSALVLFLVRYREGRAAARVDARTDTLTGLPNRRAVEEWLVRVLADHRRYDTSLGVLMIDIDRFKSINDRFGHNGGDVVLRAVATRAANCVRVNDVVGRWGGEEFLVLAPHVDEAGLHVLAERIRHAINREVVAVGSARVALTASVGGTVARNDDSASRLLERADAALYTAKNTGRDRTVITEDVRSAPVPHPA